jgi:anti-sigma regulatory factor (Ser/Thr protein kinase)
MRMIGTVALEAGGSAVGVTTFAGDVASDMCREICTAVCTYVRAVTRVVVRDATAVLSAYRPAVLALLTVQRPALRLVTAGRHGTAPSLAQESRARVTGAGSARDAAGARTRFTLTLPDDPTAPRRARELLQQAAVAWDLDDEIRHDAAMVVTELVANAVDHARTPSVVTLAHDGRSLSVSVRDGNGEQAPRPRPVDPTAPRGRGLQMVEALAASWGVTAHPDGKTVWAVLGCT